MTGTRVGFGYDAHRFGGAGPVILGGVRIDHETGVVGASDADVACHAVSDALLGAAALGDIGEFFPSADPQWHGADSTRFVAECARMVRRAGFCIGNIDVTIVAQTVRVAPHRDAMRENLAAAVGVDIEAISVKATTTDGLGWIGASAGIAAHAVVAIYR